MVQCQKELFKYSWNTTLDHRFGQAWITDFIRGEHCLIMFILTYHLMKKNEEISEEIYKNYKIISSD